MRYRRGICIDTRFDADSSDGMEYFLSQYLFISSVYRLQRSVLAISACPFI